MEDSKKIEILSFRLNQELVLLVFAIIGVIIALSWREALTSFIIEFLGLDEDSLRGKFAIALILTVVAVAFLWFFIALLKASIIAKSESKQK